MSDTKHFFRIEAFHNHQQKANARSVQNQSFLSLHEIITRIKLQIIHQPFNKKIQYSSG